LDALRYIVTGCIKFTPIAELNDPSELLPHVDLESLRDSLMRLRRDGYTEVDLKHLREQDAVLKRFAPIFRGVRAPASVAEANDVIRLEFFSLLPPLLGMLERASAEISKQIGVFCLARRIDVLPMWAHYAANGPGWWWNSHA
jgi:hypothetical protein